MDAPEIPRATPAGRTAFILPHQVHVAGTLHVEVLECEKIKKSWLGSRVYPYIRLSLANLPSMKTQVCKEKAPRWGEKFEVKVTEDMDPALRLDVVNGSKKKHKVLGSVICFFAKMVLEKRAIDTWFPLKPENSDKLITKLHCKVAFTMDPAFAQKLASLGPRFLEARPRPGSPPRPPPSPASAEPRGPHVQSQLGTYSRLWDQPADHPLNQLARSDSTMTAPPGGLVDEDPTATDDATEDGTMRQMAPPQAGGARVISVALGDEGHVDLRVPPAKQPGPAYPMPPPPSAAPPTPAASPAGAGAGPGAGEALPRFEFRWGSAENPETFGPHSAEEMVDWAEAGYFAQNVAFIRQLPGPGRRLWEGWAPSPDVDFPAIAALLPR
eukprot:tig00001094_g6987.t1